MDTREITQLLSTAGLTVELVFEGSPSACPHCHDLNTFCLAEAA